MGGTVDVLKGDRRNSTVLHQVCAHGKSIETVLTLIMLGADINAKDKTLNATPLMLACRYGKWFAVEPLLGNGADANAFDTTNRTALMYACMALKNMIPVPGKVVQLLVNRMTSEAINRRDSIGVGEGNSALHSAAKNYLDNEILEILVKAGAQKDLRNDLRQAAFDCLPYEKYSHPDFMEKKKILQTFKVVSITNVNAAYNFKSYFKF